MWRNKTRAIAPNKECVATGTKLCCQIDRGADGHSGAVQDLRAVVRWRYWVRKNTSHRGPRNPFNKTDFVFAEPGAKDEVIIRRTSFMPYGFDVLEGDRIIGGIRRHGIFLNRYSIDVSGVNSWTFRMPLFSIGGWGDSSTGVEIWVVVGPSQMEWNILIKAGVKEWPLVAALAFIHTERWNYS